MHPGNEANPDKFQSCLFELQDKSQSISQRFIINPRYYESNQTQGDGDGLYEFRPLHNSSKLYSKVQDIQVKKGRFSGQFLIHYENKVPGEKVAPKLTITAEISHLSDYVKFDVALNEIPMLVSYG